MIKINDEYYIDTDTYSFVLKKVHYAKDKKTGAETRQDISIGYYATIDIALKGYLKHRSRELVHNKDFKSIKEYLEYIKKLDKSLKEMLEDV